MIRIQLVVAVQLIGSIVRQALEGEEDITVVDVVSSPSELPEDSDQIDIICLHAETKSGNLLATIEQIREHVPGARIVLLYMPGIQDVQLSALGAGAAGFVENDQSVAEMVQTIRDVHAYGASISPDFARVLIDRVTELHHEVSFHSPIDLDHDGHLTDREWDVLALVSQGLTNAEIADRLYISVGTVKNHVHSILSKLDADSREQASYWYHWQEQAREAASSTGDHDARVGSKDGVDAPAVFTRGSLLAASQLPFLRTMLEERLSAFCRQLGWPIGHIYLLDEVTGEMVSSGIWYLEDATRFDAFRTASDSRRFAHHDSTFSQLLFSPEPAWVADVTRQEGYERAEVARSVGIRSGLFLPFFDGELVGAFEFYDVERSRPEPETVADIIQRGQEVGHRLESHVKDPAKTE